MALVMLAAAEAQAAQAVLVASVMLAGAEVLAAMLVTAAQAEFVVFLLSVMAVQAAQAQ